MAMIAAQGQECEVEWTFPFFEAWIEQAAHGWYMWGISWMWRCHVRFDVQCIYKFVDWWCGYDDFGLGVVCRLMVVFAYYVCYCCGFEQERPYHNDSTASRLLSEVKHCRARLVLRWGTTLESRVLFFCNFPLFSSFPLFPTSQPMPTNTVFGTHFQHVHTIILYKTLTYLQWGRHQMILTSTINNMWLYLGRFFQLVDPWCLLYVERVQWENDLVYKDYFNNWILLSNLRV